jgi:hypothetical protein
LLVSRCISRKAASGFFALLGMASPGPPLCDPRRTPFGCSASLTHAERRVEAEQVAVTELAVGLVPLAVGRDAVRRIGEPYRAVKLHGDVVRRIEVPPAEAVDDHLVGQPSAPGVQPRAKHPAFAVRAVQQRTVALAHVTVHEPARLAPHVQAIDRMPAQHRVVRDVAPQQLTGFAKPDRALAPDRASAQTPERTRGSRHGGETRVEHI